MKRLAVLFCTFALSTNLALAAGSTTQETTQSKTQSSQQKKMPTFTPEQRQKMAEAHEKMAACLRSDKPFSECHDEMVKMCKDKKGGCPMMGMHDHHHHKDGTNKDTTKE